MSPDELKRRSILVRGKSQVQRTSTPIKTRRPKNAVEVESHQEMSSDFFDFEKEVTDIKSASEQFQEAERLAKLEEEKLAKQKEAEEKALKEKMAPTTIAESPVILEERLNIFEPVEMQEEEVRTSTKVFTEEELSAQFYDILADKKEESVEQEEFFISSLQPQEIVLEEFEPESEVVAKEVEALQVLQVEEVAVLESAQEIVQNIVQEEVQPIVHQVLSAAQPAAKPELEDVKPKIQDKRKPKIIDFSEPTKSKLEEATASFTEKPKQKKKVIDFSTHLDLSDDGSEEPVQIEEVLQKESPKESLKEEGVKEGVVEEKSSQKTCLFIKPNGEKCKRPAPKTSDYCAAHRKTLNLSK